MEDFLARVNNHVDSFHNAQESIAASQAWKLNPALRTYEHLIEMFQDFEKTLNENQEVAVQLVSFGNGVIYHVRELDYHGPDIIVFHCVSERGDKATLIQNISQLNVLMLASQKLQGEAARIGFKVPGEK